jgi:hypothetical protein
VITIKETAIFSENDWNRGVFSGLATKDAKIYNRKKEINDREFINPIYNSWQTTIEDKYTDLVDVIDYPFPSIKIDKSSNQSLESSNSLEKIGESITSLYQDEDLTTKIGVTDLDIDFTWDVYDTIYKDKAELVLNHDSDDAVKIVFNSDSEIKLIKGDTVKEIVDSSDDSIGDIQSYISNYMDNWIIKVRLINGTLAIKLDASGYESIWYKFSFTDTEIENLKLVQYSENKNNRVINAKFAINNIYADGFGLGEYTSQVIDSLENNTVWNDLTIDGTFPKNKLVDDDLITELGLTEDTNNVKLKLYVDNERETALTKASNDNCDKEINVTTSEGQIIQSKTISTKGETVTGRYLVVKAYFANTSFYQNEINYLRFRYDYADVVEDTSYNEVDEANVAKTIDSTGGVIDLSVDNFSARLFVTNGALEEPTEITITRLAGDDERVVDDFIGFEFQPSGLIFNKPCLLEIDYDGYEFGDYQDEEGLTITYLNESNGYLEGLETELFEDSTTAVSYINHFSIYGITASNNLYSLRTKEMTSRLPGWMKLQDKNSNFHKFMNYAAARPLDKAEEDIEYVEQNRFIRTADTDMKHASFKTKLSEFTDGSDNLFSLTTISDIEEDTETKLDIKVEGKEIIPTCKNTLFFDSPDRDEYCYLDIESNMIHFEQLYEDKDIIITVTQESSGDYNNIYRLQSQLVYHHIWNVFDEFGLIVNLERLPKENNEDYKERILDVYRSPGNATKQGLINSISRELGLDKDQIEINALSDDDYKETLFLPDGTPKFKLKKMINRIQEYFNIFWDDCKWDVGYWDAIEGDGSGYSTLPSKVDYHGIEKTN